MILQFVAMISSSRADLQSKLPSIRILDNDPKKPVVRMANLCVVSSHTVDLFFAFVNFIRFLLMWNIFHFD